MFFASLGMAAAFAVSDPQAAEILSRLDMTTFRSSLRPSDADGKLRPSDWNFLAPSNSRDWSYLSQIHDGRPSWTIGLRIIRREGNAVVACFSDQAFNGGTYRAFSALRIVPDGEGGYRVAEQGLDEPGCPPARGQG